MAITPKDRRPMRRAKVIVDNRTKHRAKAARGRTWKGQQ